MKTNAQKKKMNSCFAGLPTHLKLTRNSDFSGLYIVLLYILLIFPNKSVITVFTKCYVWNICFYGTEILTLRKVNQKYLIQQMDADDGFGRLFEEKRITTQI